MHRTASLTRRCCQQSSAWLCCSASQAGPSRVMAKIALTRSHALYTAAQQGTSSRTAALSGSSRQPRFISSSLPRPMTMQKEASFASSFPQHHRSFRTSAVSLHGGKGRPKPGEGIKVTFKDSKGNIIKTVEANDGDDIVDLSWEYDLDIEAACEKSIACSTCHVILDSASYDKLEEPSDEENDMLDMAFGLEDTSRLGCQVKVTKDLDGMIIQLPSATRNFAVDGHKSKH